MAYYTGTINSLADLLTAIRTALSAEGWSLSGEISHKGTLYTSLTATVETANEATGANLPPAGSRLNVRSGNGIDGSNNLTDPAPYSSRIGYLSTATSGSAVYTEWAWPANYYIHILEDPDEVYVFVNYNTNYWQCLCFGQSPAAGNAGTGNWHHASIPRVSGPNNLEFRVSAASVGVDGTNIDNFSRFCPAPLYQISENTGSTRYNNSYFHGSIDSSTGLPIWNHHQRNLQDSTAVEGKISGATAMSPLLSLLPNAWNSEVVLVPCQILQSRPSSKVSLIGELGHLRYTRNDYLADGEIIELGPDKWKVYPVYRKNLSVRNGGNGIDHSGTIAVAIRYDGP